MLVIYFHLPSKRWQITNCFKVLFLQRDLGEVFGEKNTQRIGKEMCHVGILINVLVPSQTFHCKETYLHGFLQCEWALDVISLLL